MKYTTLSKKLDNVLKGSNISNLLNVDTIDSKTIAKRMDKCKIKIGIRIFLTQSVPDLITIPIENKDDISIDINKRYLKYWTTTIFDY